MTHREIVHVLMLSPIYFKISLTDRKQLIHEYGMLFDEVCGKISMGKDKEDRATLPLS